MPKTVFVKSNLQDYLDKKDDKLGKGMNLGQKQFPPDRVFGVRVESNEWDAGKCIKGEANSHEVRPDDDLGHTNRYGFRNITKEGDEGRTFGIPTIRYDIPKPAQQSVADPQVLQYLFRTTQMRQQRFNCYSLKSFQGSGSVSKNSEWFVPELRSGKYSRTLDFNSRVMSLMSSLKGPRPSRVPSWTVVEGVFGL